MVRRETGDSSAEDKETNRFQSKREPKKCGGIQAAEKSLTDTGDEELDDEFSRHE